MSNYYLGQNPEQLLGSSPRFFYGLRKNQNGSLFLNRVDLLKDLGAVEVNSPGNPEDNYNDFEAGVDFYEGLDVNHNPVFENLVYPQYRWDDRSLFYYVDEDGQLVVKINSGNTYDNGDSEDQ
jgi:hypothetical protein